MSIEKSSVLLLLLVVTAGGCDSPPGRSSWDEAKVTPRGGKEGPPIGRRWVLRDNDGAAVDAVAEPTCRASGPACAINDIGTVGGVTPECARVIWLGDQYVDLKYNLLSGRAEDCAGTESSGVDFGVYPDGTCGGAFYTFTTYGVESAHRFTREARFFEEEGALYFQGNEILSLDAWYFGPQCTIYEEPGIRAPWWPVPAWALDALPNPPYQLFWE